MKNLRRLPRLLCLFLLCAMPAWFAAPAYSAMPMTVQQAPAQTQNPSFMTIQDAIGQQIQALVTTATDEAEPQETFGTRVLGLVLAFVDLAHSQMQAFLTNFSAFPDAVNWFNQQANDPNLSLRWQNIGFLTLNVLGGAMLIGLALHFLLLPARRHLANRTYRNFGTRLGGGISWLILSLITLTVFVGSALILMSENDPTKLARFVVMNIVYAMALHRLIRVVLRFFIAPYAANLRLVHLCDEQAQFIQRWAARLSFVMIYGYFCVDVARSLHLPTGAITAFSSLLGLIIVIMACIIIAQKRSFVASVIRGNLSAAQHDLTLWQSLRLWLARSWHILATGYIVIGYIVTTLSVSGGFTLLLQGTILTLLVLIAMRLSFHGIGKVGINRRPSFHHPLLRGFLAVVVWVSAAIALLWSWGVDMAGLLATPWGQRFAGSALSITATVFIVTALYEWVSDMIERRLVPREVRGEIITPSARALTLLPMARNTALIALSGAILLMILSEMGMNIAPLLAGAGVIGVAVGFGSQSLVKDFITGLFILIEDTVAVGDVIKMGDLSGSVESLTIRTLRIRAADGALHIVPFGEVSKFTNLTKGFAYAAVNLGVSYKSDLRHVMAVITEVGNSLRGESEFQESIIEPIEVLGVDKLGDSSIIIACRIKTLPGKQWGVKRAFLLAIKERFDKEGIEIPFPTTMQYTMSLEKP